MSYTPDPIRGILANMAAASHEVPVGLQGMTDPFARLGMPFGGAVQSSMATGPTTPNMMPNMGGMGRAALPSAGSMSSLGAFRPVAPTGLRGYAGRGLGAAGIYQGLNSLGGALGRDDNPAGQAGYGISSAALPAAGTFAATGAAVPTAIAGLGVGLGTGIARALPGGEDNSWGNVFENIQRGTGTYAPDVAMPSALPLSTILDAYRGSGNELNDDRLATILVDAGVEGATRDGNGKVTLEGNALKMLETVRDSPERMAGLASLAEMHDLTPEDMAAVDQAYMMALLTSDDPNSKEARDQALGIAQLAITETGTQRQAQLEAEQQYTEMALAYQTAAQQILGPVTASLDAQAEQSYNRMMQATSMLPPDMQGVARMQAEQQYAGSQMVSGAYRAQAATMLPSLAIEQQMASVQQLAGQLQPQALDLGLEALLAGGTGAPQGMTLADLAA